jgi:hypothetical protein
MITFLLILKQHANGRRVGVIVLAALHTPVKNNQKGDGYGETNQYKQDNDFHVWCN